MSELELSVSKVLVPLSLLVLYFVTFLVSKWAANKLTPYDIYAEIGDKHNKAVSLALSGYLIAVTIIFIGALLGPSKGLLEDLYIVGGYSLAGVLLLNLSRVINDKLILYKFENKKELISDQNEGTGAVVAGSYIASGLIIAGGIHGEGGGFGSALVFFAIGQIALVLFSKVYNFVTPYDIHEEIEQDNVAAGVAFGGTLVALGVILMNGSSGDFVSWSYNIQSFIVLTLGAFVILPLFRLLMDKFLIPHFDLNHEIHNDKNVSAGILEFVMVVCFASIVFYSV